jgi:glycolate oxidase FAD binding subunit
LFEPLQPTSAEELCDQLAGAASAKRSIELFGANTKRLMAGAPAPASVQISTTKLTRIIQYEPRDLTISVEAGMPFAALCDELAKHGQMVPLDGPWSESATVGGMIAANINGSRRRLYGTARDLVIGMQFATVDGKLVQSGGMVVKNVAGLDMAKLMIGSFGTLAAITKVNFKLIPVPPASGTLLFSFDDLKTASEARDAAIQGVLTPVAVDLINPILAAHMNLKGYVLALLFSGNEAVIERSGREAEKLGRARALSAAEDQKFRGDLDALTPRHLDKFKEGAVVRVSTKLSDCSAALGSIEGPGHALAASGIVRGWFTRPDTATRWLDAALKRGWKGVIEYSGENARRGMTLWPDVGSDFEIMKKIKAMFDPEGLLNSGRYYGRF